MVSARERSVSDTDKSRHRGPWFTTHVCFAAPLPPVRMRTLLTGVGFSSARKWHIMLRALLGCCVSSCLIVAAATITIAAEPEPIWRAAAGSVVITPSEPMYLAGFGNRIVPAEGTALDLKAKCLAIEERASRAKLVVLTLDLIDVPIQLRNALEKHVTTKHALPPASLLLNCSHTHCGPELRYDEKYLAELAPERAAMCRRYNAQLPEKLATLVDDCLNRLEPADLAYGHARCGFAMNRRLKNSVPGEEPYLNRPNPEGVVDHAVPVLRVRRATASATKPASVASNSPTDAQPLAVLFGYACHNTTLALKQFHPDYAGYAQQAVEAAHPGTVALFLMGCGGDQNGYPRMKLAYSEQHGKSLAIAVEAALEATLRPIRGPLRMAYGTVPLDFQPVPSKEVLRARLQSTTAYQGAAGAFLKDWDRRRLAELERGTLITSYPFPGHVVRWGDDLLLVALAGETVVDYSLRVKRDFAGPAAVWVAGYSNDVFAYVPSRRVLLEGGYEADRSMIYMTNPVMPGPFEPSLEERIFGKLRALYLSTLSQVEPGAIAPVPAGDRLPGTTIGTTTKFLTPRPTDAAVRDWPGAVSQLKTEQVLDGWIGLFDGASTFGFQDAKLLSHNGKTVLVGGRSTTAFSGFALQVVAANEGTLSLGETTYRLAPGPNAIVHRGPAVAVALGEQTAVETLFLKPLDRKALFNGKDLTDWDLRAFGRTKSTAPASWTIENGAIRARGGPGALEYAPRSAEALFGDFLVQCLVTTRAPETNGGLFLRNEPGKTMMGYEVQLHHRWYDQTKGEHGYTTGGIDDRQQARKAVARDGERTLVTAVLHGPHIATWVNGYQVCDWTDTRPLHPNPRNGRRVEPGTLQLQAHDPQTDLEFHNVWVQPMTP